MKPKHTERKIGLLLTVALLFGGLCHPMLENADHTDAVIYTIAAEETFITALTVNDSENSGAWSVAGTLQTGGKVFGDRDVVFATVPNSLIGAQVLQTACNSKKFIGEQAVFIAGSDIMVYIGADTRTAAKPWLSDWTKTAETLTDTGNPVVTYQVYKKRFQRGETVTIGMLGESNCVNYLVMAKAAAEDTVVGKRGDLNGDGECSLVDMVLLQKWLNAEKTEIADWRAGDYDDNAILNAIDLTLLKRQLLTMSREPQPIAIDVSTLNNPFVGNITQSGEKYTYGGDPAAFVDGDTVYVYTGHDISSNAEVDKSIYNIPEYLCYSTKDLIHWKSEGVVMNMRSVTWGDAKSAWASQVVKHNQKYYLYFCSWDKTAEGKQSIGVAVADSPTGPFTDIGHSLIKGTLTGNQKSDWDDIDPTVWVEKESNGIEHRYLAWGNTQYYVCELNDDMISVKDGNGDGRITFAGDGNNGDVFHRQNNMGIFTEAPWLYRRQNENGEYYGNYYLIYASGWREQMAYSTCTDLLKGDWTYGGIIFDCNATSNTNHSGIFDFKGKTYMIYHNGALPEGNGYRRCPNLCEVHFDNNGKILKMEETTAGIGGIVSRIDSQNGKALAHEHFTNATNDAPYPYTNLRLGFGMSNATTGDSSWVIVPGLANVSEPTYVSIESENKTGLFVTAETNRTGVGLSQPVTLLQNDLNRATFRTIEGLSDRTKVSFESVAFPGTYLTCTSTGSVTLSDGSDSAASTFSISKQ